MAVLRHENGMKNTSADDIARALQPLGVQLARWPVGDDPALRNLLSEPVLDATGKEAVLAALEARFDELKRVAGYRSRDLVVLHPDLPKLVDITRPYLDCHVHADDEVRYVVDGEGVFGFVLPDGQQVELTVVAEEYINVPARVEHWFHLTASRRIKAVRYFTDTADWTPEYTGTARRYIWSEPVT